MTWGPINDSQTPNWGAVVLVGVAFQFGAFQPSYQVAASAMTWTVVNDSQGSGWSAVATNTGNWAPVSDTQVPGWVPVT